MGRFPRVPWGGPRSSGPHRRPPLPSLARLLLLLPLLWQQPAQGRPAQGPPITDIFIVSERHHGSTFLSHWIDQAAKAAPPVVLPVNTTAGSEGGGGVVEKQTQPFVNVRVHNNLCLHKHWHQTRVHEELLRNPKRPCHPEGREVCLRTDGNPQALVLVLTRDVYSWLAAMEARAHYNPSHNLQPLEQFVSARYAPSMELEFEPGTSPLGHPVCQGFRTPNEVTPCLGRMAYNSKERRDWMAGHRVGQFPAYDLDADGQPFANIVRMRTDKLRDFLRIREWMTNVEVVSYNSLMEGNATAGATALLTWWDGLVRKYGLRPLNALQRHNVFVRQQAALSARKAREPAADARFTQQILDTVNAQLDPDFEAALGYSVVRDVADLDPHLQRAKAAVVSPTGEPAAPAEAAELDDATVSRLNKARLLMGKRTSWHTGPETDFQRLLKEHTRARLREALLKSRLAEAHARLADAGLARDTDTAEVAELHRDQEGEEGEEGGEDRGEEGMVDRDGVQWGRVDPDPDR